MQNQMVIYIGNNAGGILPTVIISGNKRNGEKLNRQ
jgi:hypothetical protein